MLAILLSNGILTGLSSTTFNLFQPMVIAFLINATFKSYPHLCRSKHHTIIVAVLSLLILLFFKQPFIIPLSFLVAGFYGYHFIENSRSSIPVRFQTRIKSRFFILFITLFIISGFLSELARKADFRNRYYFNLIEHNYRFGSLTFGGGDVLIPLLYEQYVTRPTSPVVKRKNPDVLKIEKQDLLAGAGFIRLMPGPIFSITSFVSVFLMKDMPISAQLFGSLLSTFAIFIPGFLIILFFYPLWINVKSVDKFSGIIQGVNLSVLSIMVASSIYLTVDIFRYGMLNELNPALILLQLTTILLLLRYTNVPSFVIAVGCLCYGLI